MKFATVCVDIKDSGSFVLLLTKLIKSLLAYNDFNWDFYVFCDNRLSLERRNELTKHYDRFIFCDVDRKKYIEKNKEDVRYYSIETFNLKTDKVIFLDCDIICRDDISELIYEYNDGIWMIQENRRKCDYNVGVMVINKEYLNEKVYNYLLNMNPDDIDRFGHDQKLYNHYFKDKINKLPLIYNTLVTELDWAKFNEIKLLHYIHKPNLNTSANFFLNRKDLKVLWESI